MATSSAQSLPLSPPPPSPPRKRLSKVLTGGRRRSSDVQSENGTTSLHGSIESLGLAKPPSVQSRRSPSRDGSTRSSTSGGVKKLVPGHAKRERKRIREEELQRIADEEVARGRQPAPTPDSQAPGVSPVARPSTLNRSRSSLVTVDSDVESRPSLISHDSHAGYLTTSSPLIMTTTVGSNEEHSSRNPSPERFPSIAESHPTPISVPTSPKSPPRVEVPSLPKFANLTDKANTLKPGFDSSQLRGKSPARRFRDVFAKTGKSPRVSPERRDIDLATTVPVHDGADLDRSSTGFGERRLSNNPEARAPSPLRAQTLVAAPVSRPTVPPLQVDTPQPRTPPGSIFHNPTTTITPPTPTNPENRKTLHTSPKPDYAGGSWPEQNTAAVQSNGHRRVRSHSGAMHQKSKLSTSTIPPLTPTIEEVKTPTLSSGTSGSRNVSSGNGFFSSWVSAAQNAATSITNLTNQNRSRAGTTSSDSSKTKTTDTPPKEKEVAAPNLERLPQELKKELAVDTLGSGDLNLSHLGIEEKVDKRAPSPSRSEHAASVKDDMAARMEDLLAKRAVSQAYEKPSKSGEATPIAEISDPVASVRPASTFDSATGALTPPNGSIFEGETNGVKRTNSVRSKLHDHRSRGSSVTTAQSTVGGMMGASTTTLTNATAASKLSGFAIAPKPRNRAFHQQFRSVPEDDFLIEDYSCALQKEILLAGRIYISEGHICFSSNILGWVTTLIISFEEVVSIEKENTAIVIPNAIAVQTLHARHTFRSLLSREATYDLMIGIWRVSHPDSFEKSMNGQKLAAEMASAENAAINDEAGDAPASGDSTEETDSEDDDDDQSVGDTDSLGEQEYQEAKSLSRKPSGGKDIGSGPIMAASVAPASGDATSSVAPIVATADSVPDFPGPATHAPTECADTATHYDKIIKDEVIQAPLGRIYTLLYGTQSTTFMRKFLVDGVSKAQDLQMEDDKKGLDNENKSRKYQYVKPLGGSIGPKQTTCITTEVLDMFDLEKAVSVSCTTATPDVPSGSAFSTKTKYCLTWAPGNATRFQMNMTIEWTAKSWLKNPIEKGALDGQQQYGDDLIKTIKAALGRSRATTAGSKVLKNGKKKRKSSKRDKSESAQAESKKDENWGPIEFLRPMLNPIVAPVKPFVQTNIVVAVLTMMVLWMWFRGTSSRSSLALLGKAERGLYYDDLWRREENELWGWLEDRASIDGMVLRESLQSNDAQKKDNKQKLQKRQKLLKSKNMQTRLREEKMTVKEMEEAVRVTQERLESLQRNLERHKNDGH
ncbi:hypothetical protein LTS08_006289 [Lithohypha guttulata]|nr:hypothetical protein LTS08_006289 [Lithohypha guttulata]